jgi:hypothetical protein
VTVEQFDDLGFSCLVCRCGPRAGSRNTRLLELLRRKEITALVDRVFPLEQAASGSAQAGTRATLRPVA